MRLVGMYEHSLDAKGRIILPAKFRGNFDSNLALVSKHNEGCLAIWTPEAFDNVAAEMAARMEGTPEERQMARSWAMGSAEVDLDPQGRLAIPQHLRDFAHLEQGRTVLVHGAITHIELWDKDAWDIQGAMGDSQITGGVPANAAPAEANPSGE
jgi:MraZ protein